MVNKKQIEEYSHSADKSDEELDGERRIDGKRQKEQERLRRERERAENIENAKKELKQYYKKVFEVKRRLCSYHCTNPDFNYQTVYNDLIFIDGLPDKMSEIFLKYDLLKRISSERLNAKNIADRLKELHDSYVSAYDSPKYRELTRRTKETTERWRQKADEDRKKWEGAGVIIQFLKFRMGLRSIEAAKKESDESDRAHEEFISYSEKNVLGPIEDFGNIIKDVVGYCDNLLNEIERLYK
jgi:hypothetical protein